MMTKMQFTAEVVRPGCSRFPVFRATGVTRFRLRLQSALPNLRRKPSQSPEFGMQTKRRPVHSTGSQQSLTIVLISDTHELHREVEVPDGNLLIHCGDWTMFSRSLKAIVDFNDWLGELPHPHKVCVPGNHETYLQNPANRSLITNAALLINEGIEIEGLGIWGTPVTPIGPAFRVCAAEERLQIHAEIPDNTDVLISHGPPLGVLDRSPGSSFHAGDQELLDAVTRVKPRLHVFGHIHGAHGLLRTQETLFANAAVLGPSGHIDKQPIALRMVRK
jgi:Icc-related predicted phosphoesterase